MRNNKPDIYRSEQGVLNWSFDEILKVLAIMPVEYDGTNAIRKTSSLVATKITESGSYTYIAKAPIGTAQATAAWQVMRVEEGASDTIITWADGNGNFDNVATDLTALSFS